MVGNLGNVVVVNVHIHSRIPTCTQVRNDVGALGSVAEFTPRMLHSLCGLLSNVSHSLANYGKHELPITNLYSTPYDLPHGGINPADIIKLELPIMFHDGDLQSGISRAIQEQKLVACFVCEDDKDESELWESSYLPSADEALSTKTVLLRLDFGGQEASFLSAFCPITEAPTLVIIHNGQVLEKLESGIDRDEFLQRLGKAVGVDIDASNYDNEKAEREPDSQLSQAQPDIATTATPEESTSFPPVQEPTSVSNSMQGLFPGRAQQLETEYAKREESEKAERAARTAARKKEAEEAHAAHMGNKNDKGKQRASSTTAETAEKEKARQAWIVQQKTRKDEAKRERERILNQIESDKQERRARAQMLKEANAATNGGVGASEPLPSSLDAASKRRMGAGGMCSLQVRLFDGSSIRGRFEPSATLASTVRDWVKETAGDGGADIPYTFRQILAPQPSRTIEVSEEHQTLADLDLTPSATLILAPVPGYTEAYASSGGYLSSAFKTVYRVAEGATGVLSSALTYVPGFGGGGGGGDASSSSANTSGPSDPMRAQTAGEASQGNQGQQYEDGGTTGASSKIRVKTLADQRAETAKEQPKSTEFYNGNSSAFQGRKDDDSDK